MISSTEIKYKFDNWRQLGNKHKQGF